VSKLVRNEIESTIPLKPTYEQVTAPTKPILACLLPNRLCGAPIAWSAPLECVSRQEMRTVTDPCCLVSCPADARAGGERGHGPLHEGPERRRVLRGEMGCLVCQSRP
jgi:hypothetical protein